MRTCNWPRFRSLLRAAPAQREQVEISRIGLHWEAIDEDISVAGLLAGHGDVNRGSERLRPSYAGRNLLGARQLCAGAQRHLHAGLRRGVRELGRSSWPGANPAIRE